MCIYDAKYTSSCDTRFSKIHIRLNNNRFFLGESARANKRYVAGLVVMTNAKSTAQEC